MKHQAILSAALSFLLLPPHQVMAGSGNEIMEELRSQISLDYKKINPLKRASNCQADENRFAGIQYGLMTPFREALEKKNISALNAFFTDVSEVESFSAGKSSDKKSDGLIVSNWKKSPSVSKGSGALKDYLSEFTEINHADLDTFEYFIDHSWRAQDKSYSKLRARTEFRINGIDQKGQRRMDRLQVLFDIQEQAGQWKISAVRLTEGERVVALRAPAFTDITKTAGLDQVPVHLRREAMRRGGYSVTVTDMNNDGVSDLFFGSGAEAESFLGKKGESSFERMKSGQTPKGTLVKTSVFADFDNDGDQDAVLVRFVDDDKNDDEVVFYRNNGKGEFAYEPLLKGASSDKIYPMPAAVGDFNKDNFLDLYVGYPGKQDFTTLASEDDSASRASILPHGMFFNVGGKAFNNVTTNVLKASQTSGTHLFPHSALAFDYDHNQTTDIIVIDDRNNLSPMYKNNGKTFDQVADKIGIGNNGYGMSVAVGDYNNDGLLDIAQTNVETIADNRFRSSCSRNWDVPVFAQAQGLRLFKNEGNGTFTDVTALSKLTWPGAATGGLTFIDYNNDGLEDLYVVNGLWSGNTRGNDLDSLWSSFNGFNSINTTMKGPSNRPQSKIMQLLMNFKGTVHDGKVTEGLVPSLAGFQRNKLYRNNGNGTFTEVAFVENIDEINDGYAVATLDVNRDGKLDLLLRNADPGSEMNKFPSVQLFTNSTVNKHKSITLGLHGTDSSRDAIGTEVIASYNGKKHVKQLIANNGPQQSERTLHFGLGAARSADLTIRWPNGKTEVRKNVAPGFYELTEPRETRKISAAE